MGVVHLGPTNMSDLTGLTVTGLLASFSDQQADPNDAIEAVLARIDDVDKTIHAVVTTNADAARVAAARSTQRWQAGSQRPLEGVPFAVKDIIETADLLTTAGSPLFAAHVPATNATVVTRLQDAGAVMVAKTATPEFAFGDETTDGVVNPLDPTRWVGGSSSGSAAGLASHQFPLALGTDTGGSIRVPASYCGVSGFKPTFGRVPRGGIFATSWTLDHVGPMARSVDDLALAMSVLAGGSPCDSHASNRQVPDYVADATEPIAGLRIGVADGWFSEGCSDAVLAARDSALEVMRQLGATVVPVTAPSAELAGTVSWLITVAEFASHHSDRLDELQSFSPSAAHRLSAGAAMSAVDYLKALRARPRIQREFDDVFADVDVMVTPATPCAAPVPAEFFDDGDRLWLDRVAGNFLPFNVTGMPALVIPAGLDDTLPVSIQIVAPPHADALCLRVGAAFQRATRHHLSQA
jgi:aspartyl-tRNA(Asn)/glutamyl-tRNA(Gln) amidotransferase subunit A